MMKSYPYSHLLTKKEFASREGVHVSTIKRRIKDNQISTVKLSSCTGQRKNRPSTLIHYLELSSPEKRESFLKSRNLPHDAEIGSNSGEFNNLKKWKREIADKRESVVKEFEQVIINVPRKKVTQFTKDYAAQNGISVRTLMNWRNAYRAGGYLALAPEWHNGSKQEILTAEMKLFIRQRYLQPYGPSIRVVFEELCAKFEGDVLPSYRTVVEYIKRTWTKSEQLVCRDKAEWDRKYSPYIRRDWTKLVVNELWVADGKMLDIFVMYKNKRIRPWITVIMDAKTKAWVGWILSEYHSSFSLMQAFSHAVAKYGPPKELLLDNGKAEKSKRFAGNKIKEGESSDLLDSEQLGIARNLGTTIIYASPYSGREKPIEPSFNWFNRMRTWPGYCGNKALNRKIKEGNLLTMNELQERIDKLIDEHNSLPRASNGVAPNKAYDNFVPIIPSRDLLDYLMMDRDFRVVRDGTVSIERFLYRAPGLWRLAGERVEIRRDPRDYRRAVIIHGGKIICAADLEIPDHYKSAITAEHRKELRRERRQITQDRKIMISGEVSTDPAIRAAEMAEAEETKPRDIRPASSPVRGFHLEARTAQAVKEALTAPPAGEMEQVRAVAGGDIFTRFTNACMTRTKKVNLSLESISGPLSFFDNNDDGGF